eukprot:CAMPEP_0197673534 /NCGR_PEP_ID=MMETSP1338-20131121/81140_1 /TAXON_ID=43686 ORGANISM="Pelagodinium beii, Strain RCC1491" /NCGR_SAMPLE_ID=MMETSP1338 /ASSEMBLY_ACC=CAM_ASM_000754 /LENGTH=123 /DNA_ID=CAMNT_0043253799 /DNA_START=36 /DNA_END=403 /DNA_ORIENTATION=-
MSSRHMALAGSRECLALGRHNNKPTIVHETCQAGKKNQLIPAAEIGYLFTLVHTENMNSEQTLQQGLKGEVYFGASTSDCSFPDLNFELPDHTQIDHKLDISDSDWHGLRETDHFAVKWIGFL